MSTDLSTAIESVNEAAETLEDTRVFIDETFTKGDTETATNPNNGVTVDSIAKQVKNNVESLVELNLSSYTSSAAASAAAASDYADAAQSALDTMLLAASSDASYEFATVSGMKSGSLISGDSFTSTDVDSYGAVIVKTQGYYDGWSASEEPEGAAEYIVTTIAMVQSAYSDTSWTPDGYGDHYMFGGTTYVAMLNVKANNRYVSQYGADGVSPATPNIQAALNQGGKVILTDQHYYQVADLYIMNSRTHLTGGPYSVLNRVSNTGAGAVISNGSGSILYDVKLIGFRIEGNSSNQGLTGNDYCVGIRVNGANGWRIRDVFINDPYSDGIWVQGESASLISLDTYISGCRIYGGWRTAVYFADYAATMSLYDNIISDGGFDLTRGCISIHNVDVRIWGNHIHNSSTVGVGIAGRNCQFFGNHVESNDRHGVYIYTSSGCVVTNNVIVKNSRIAANYGLYDGIYVASNAKDAIISNNRTWSEEVEDDNGDLIQRYGITLESGCEDIICTNNSFTGNLLGGINDEGAVDSIIKNNTPIEDNTLELGSYDVRFGFASSPSSSEVIDTFPIVRDVTFAADFSGSVGNIGTNPSSSFVLSIKDDGTEIGTVTVSTGGDITLATTSNESKTIAAGSILTVVAPSSADASIENLVVTIAGVA